MTTYKVSNKLDSHSQPTAEIWLAEDGAGNVDIMIDDMVVAFFNNAGELYRVNFPPAEIGPLQRVGIRFERGKGRDEEFFVIKLGGEEE